MRSSFRVGAALLAALALVGCKNKGENLPLEVAMYRVFAPDVPERVLPSPPPAFAPPTEVVRMGDQLWQAGYDQYRLPVTGVQRVGSAGGLTFYALAWDSAPYDRLLVNVPGRADQYREFVEVY